jgi:hypothetical protein
VRDLPHLPLPGLEYGSAGRREIAPCAVHDPDFAPDLDAEAPKLCLSHLDASQLTYLICYGILLIDLILPISISR